MTIRHHGRASNVAMSVRRTDCFIVNLGERIFSYHAEKEH